MAPPRTILYTGKGGVGKTSVAAATARRCAAAGLRTVVLSTDPAHSLSDSLEAELGPDPTPVGDRLWGQEVAGAEREMEAHWGAVQRWLGALLADRGVMDIAAEELTVPPGMDELFSLLQIKRHHDVRRVRRGDRRLRADRRDAAPARRSPTSPAGGSRRCSRGSGAWSAPRARSRGLTRRRAAGRRRASPRSSGWSRNLIAMNEILRDRERGLDPAGHEPRPDGDQRGAAHVHLPQPLRLPDRRGDRQPDLPRRARRRLLRRVARAPARAARGGARAASRRSRCSPRATSTRR